MNVGLSSLQTSLINYSARQHVFKPIALLVAGIAFAIFSALIIGSDLSRNRRNRREYQNSNRRYQNTISIQQSTSLSQPIYHGPKYIHVSEERINSRPYAEIKDLAKSIRSASLSLELNVKFEKHEWVESGAGDAGGPTRQYFNLLFKSLKTLFSSEGAKPGDFMINAKENSTFLVPQGKQTNDPTSSIFYDIGTVMMYVFSSSRTPLIGSIFHESIFATILSLDDHEIDTPFAQLSVAVKAKMCRALLQTLQASGSTQFNAYLPILAFLEKGAQFTENDLTDEVKYYYGSVEDEWATRSKSPAEFLLPGGDEMTPPELNVGAIMINLESRRRFLNKCLQHVLSMKDESFGVKDDKSFGSLELTLFPIHTMAKAMKEVSDIERWSEIRSLSLPSTNTVSSEIADPQLEAARKLQRKIQGELDRKVLVARIKATVNVNTPEVVKNQIEWIKQWILDDITTVSLLEGLLTFWTGSSHIAWDKVESIAIYGSQRGLLPGASTCGRALHISDTLTEKNASGELPMLHNHTKEGYYQVLNKIASEYSTVYTHY